MALRSAFGIRHSALCCGFAALCFLAVIPPVFAAAPPDAAAARLEPIPPAQLDRAISETISRPEYAWRLPRERPPKREHAGFFARCLDSIGEWIGKAARAVWRVLKKIARWVRDLFSMEPDSPAGEIGWQTPIQLLLLALLLVTGSVLGIALCRMWRNRTRTVGTAVEQPVSPAPDLTKDDTVATDLPADQWMKLAHELFLKGELRLGLRAMFLGTLAFLARHERLTIARHKSNREYVAELRRKAHDKPRVLEAFGRNVRSIERIWYGTHPATETLVAAFRADLAAIADELKPQQPAQTT
ncbi:MAG: DUF4129 domain-containing protein [Verrucomicrobiota bacterium]|nr:DUF4129 domain-containing protein [Verrucomicrobiota bacterium]